MGCSALVTICEPPKIPPAHFEVVLGPKSHTCEQWQHPLRTRSCSIKTPVFRGSRLTLHPWTKELKTYILLDPQVVNIHIILILLLFLCFLCFPILYSSLSQDGYYQIDTPSPVRCDLRYRIYLSFLFHVVLLLFLLSHADHTIVLSWISEKYLTQSKLKKLTSLATHWAGQDTCLQQQEGSWLTSTAVIQMSVLKTYGTSLKYFLYCFHY